MAGCNRKLPYGYTEELRTERKTDLAPSRRVVPQDFMHPQKDDRLPHRHEIDEGLKSFAVDEVPSAPALQVVSQPGRFFLDLSIRFGFFSLRPLLLGKMIQNLFNRLHSTWNRRAYYVPEPRGRKQQRSRRPPLRRRKTLLSLRLRDRKELIAIWQVLT